MMSGEARKCSTRFCGVFCGGVCYCIPSNCNWLRTVFAGRTRHDAETRQAQVLALLVKLWRFFECLPLLVVMTENHQPDMLPFDQIKQFNCTGADCGGVRI